MPPKKSENVVVEAPCCTICAEPYTAVLRKKIECNSCHKDLCTKCVERYLVSSIEDPHCLHCRASWTRSFLASVCSMTFLNKTYYVHRQEVLVNREKSFLPTYQPVAAREVRAREISKEDQAVADEYYKLEKEMNKKLAELSKQRSAIWRRVNNVRAGLEENAAAGEKAKAVVSKFVRRCTAADCKGFLSSAWKCGLCSSWACPDCFEIKGLVHDAPHTCTADALATAALIRKDTKPCPTCGEMISKIDGCDQMFCTSCHSPFSWTTGHAIKTGIIHNPHYFQWLAKGGQAAPQNPGFIPCGGLPNPYHVQTALATANKEDRKELLDILRICGHMSDVERHRYERHLDPLNNEDVGVQYLLKESSEENWKQTLAKREKERQKSNEIRDILDAFNGAAIDLFRRIDTAKTPKYDKEEATKLIMELRIELEELRKFTFTAMSDVGKSFNCSVPWINDKWEVIHGTERTRKKKEEEAEAREQQRAKDEAERKRVLDAAAEMIRRESEERVRLQTERLAKERAEANSATSNSSTSNSAVATNTGSK